MVETELTRIEKGVMYFRKAVKRDVKFEAEIVCIESRVDSNGRPFKTVTLVREGEKREEKWNCFDLEECRRLKYGESVVKGTYFGPFKKQLNRTERIKKRRMKL